MTLLYELRAKVDTSARGLRCRFIDQLPKEVEKYWDFSCIFYTERFYKLKNVLNVHLWGKMAFAVACFQASAAPRSENSDSTLIHK
jgi:hypothetical protein